jgi:hypothetical protein
MPRDSRWHSGVTQNVSGSGAVICCTQPRHPGDVVEVRIALPAPGNERAGILTGLGRVVRTCGAQGATRTFAIEVKRYRLEPLPDPR